MLRITKTCFAILLAFCMLLSGCASLPPQQTTPPTADTVSTEPTFTEPLFSRSDMLEAYRMALQRFYDEHIWPDGSEAAYDEAFDSMDENYFAIADVDGDGDEELIISFSSTYTAGMLCGVFGYDNASGTLHSQLWEFPAVSWYPNGVLKADASHNHSLCMDFWPYNFYRYDALTDSYKFTVSVSAWNREEYPTDFSSDAAFPEEKAEGGNLVYLLTRDEETKILSPSEFDRWETENFGEALPLDITWQPLQDAYIHRVTD